MFKKINLVAGSVGSIWEELMVECYVYDEIPKE